MVESVRHFAYYLYGHKFKIYTDHKPLVHLLQSDKLNPRLRRLSYKMQGWLTEIEYLPGEENGFADALSREERSRSGQQEGDGERSKEDERRNPPGLSSHEGGCGGM